MKRFAERVLKKAATPLLPTTLLQTKVYDLSSKLSPRSTRIVAQFLAKISIAKRGEALVMQRLGLLQGRTMEEAKQ